MRILLDAAIDQVASNGKWWMYLQGVKRFIVQLLSTLVLEVLQRWPMAPRNFRVESLSGDVFNEHAVNNVNFISSDI